MRQKTSYKETVVKLRILIKKSTGWLHATLIMALIAPLLYALGAERQDTIGQTLYLKCLLIAFPIVVTDFAITKCRSLFSYLIISALTFAATGMAGWTIAGSMRESIMFWGYMLLLLGETVFVIISRIVSRLQKKEAEEAARGEDTSFRPAHDALREPSFLVLLYFMAVYTVALNLDNPPVCNTALFSAILYTPVTFLYHYICETENYLFLHKRTCNLPSKRIYGIGNGMLALFLLLFLLILLPVLFTISGRHYRDLRKWTAPIDIDFTELPTERMEGSPGEDPMAALMAEYGEPKPTPRWLILLSYIMEAFVFLSIIILLVKSIISTFHAFRASKDENGDIVEELEDTDDVRKIALPARRRKLSERERIRKEYRKTIRRNRKDRPAASESPLEIEKNAGIADQKDIQELHRNYELARYGRNL